MQQVWRKRWELIRWLALGAVTLVLFVSAAYNKDHKVCSGIEVSFQSDGNNYFIDEKGVLAVLKSYGQIEGEQMNKIDLTALETRLKTDRWIANADLFFDNKQKLQVVIEEKEPVARIFTSAGSSFYIDSACNKLPLSPKLSARIPMFTNFPSGNQRLSKPDSALLSEAKELAVFVQQDEFWKAQVSQIDITPEGFEMIPTVGNHIVVLGKQGPWSEKFDKLYSFYKQVWTKVGFEKYEKIDVRYDDQVVATIKGAKPATVDSAKALLAYQKVIDGVKADANDSANVKKSNGGLDTANSKQGTKRTTLSTVVKQSVAKVKDIKVLGTQKLQHGNEKVDLKPAEKLNILKQATPGQNRIPKAIMKKPVVKNQGNTN